jgi:hypothetical protein
MGRAWPLVGEGVWKHAEITLAGHFGAQVVKLFAVVA